MSALDTVEIATPALRATSFMDDIFQSFLLYPVFPDSAEAVELSQLESIWEGVGKRFPIESAYYHTHLLSRSESLRKMNESLRKMAGQREEFPLPDSRGTVPFITKKTAAKQSHSATVITYINRDYKQSSYTLVPFA